MNKKISEVMVNGIKFYKIIGIENQLFMTRKSAEKNLKDLREEAKVAFRNVIDYLNYLDLDDYTQDPELFDLFKKLQNFLITENKK